MGGGEDSSPACAVCWRANGPGPGGEVTAPAPGLRDTDAPPACRWESQGEVSSPINWRAETLPPSPRGAWTLARAGLSGKPGQLCVGLPGPPGRWHLESELRTRFPLSETSRPDLPSCLLYVTRCLLPPGLDPPVHVMGALPPLGMVRV